jgi:hypothetical protein
MNTQDLTIPGVNPFTFAGFQWPRHIARMACGPAALRKKWAGRRAFGEYYRAPRPETAGTGREFYLESAGQPFTRWQWCDEVDGIRIDHTGWFCDEVGVDKIRGIVAALPHGRFLAGCSMGEGKASTVAADLYNTAEAAARAADRMAESAAEDEREHQAQQIEEMENLK